MASISKHGQGWRAQVARKGQRRSKVFQTKQEAKDWAAQIERGILDQEGQAARMPLGDLLERYARERSPAKRGARWEIVRLERLRGDPVAAIPLCDLRPADLTDWRERRLGEVAPGSVAREMTLLNTVLNTARREWGLLSANPLQDVRKPRQPPPRDRLPTDDEIERLAHAAGSDLTRKTARAFHAFQFAIETAMRAGEICGLTWDRIDMTARVARLEKTKNGHPRDVPLSLRAVDLLTALPELDPVFGLTPHDLDALFRKLKGRAMIEGLTFHDSRAAAATRMATKVGVLELARITGHKDLRVLQRYYRESASELARRLD